MTYRRKRDNLFALILVLMISLITSPASGMSMHQSHMQATSVASPSSMMTASESCHQPTQQAAKMHPDCCTETDMSSLCSDCSSTHCQPYSSDLPVATGAITNLPRERLVPLMSALQPVSRTETLFRPPIV